MNIKNLPVTIVVEISATEGETLRRKGTLGNLNDRKAVVPASDVDNWESVPESVVIAEMEAIRLEKEYKADVVRRIRLKYSADDEAAILRKRLALMDSDENAQEAIEEFQEYNSYVENCKAEARQSIYPQPEPEPPVEEVEPEEVEPEEVEPELGEIEPINE